MEKRCEVIDVEARDRLDALEKHLGIRCIQKTSDMTFGEALLWLKDGKKVGRWHRDTIWVYILNPSPANMLPELRVKTINGDDTVWCPNHAELLAVDWRVIDEG